MSKQQLQQQSTFGSPSRALRKVEAILSMGKVSIMSDY